MSGGHFAGLVVVLCLPLVPSGGSFLMMLQG